MPTIFKSKDENSTFQNNLLNNQDKMTENPNIVDIDEKKLVTDSPKKHSSLSFGKLISIFLFFISVILIGSFIFAYTQFSSSNNGLADDGNGNFFSQIGQIGNLLNITKRNPIKGEADGRTNFLLIGRDATGGGLTDTIIVASYFHKEQKMTTVNIPRDMVYRDNLTGTTEKINALSEFAQGLIDQKNQYFSKYRSGDEYLGEFLGKDLDIPIHYVASINFNGVKEVVDTLGGIEVNVENTFTDYKYPNYRQELLRPAPTFEQGLQTMNGDRALIYARSRHAGDIYNDFGPEAGDYARNKRQSKVVAAILEKIKAQNIFDNVSKISAFFNIINTNFKTNMKLDEVAAVAQILKENNNVKDNYVTNVWSTDDGRGILCEASTPTSSQSGYCGGGYLGGGTSSGREKARSFVENILTISSNSALSQAKTVVLGNQSYDTQKIYDELVNNQGFENITLNNSYTKIKEANATSVETTKIYILDSKLKDLFNNLRLKPSLKYQVIDKIPDDLPLPISFKDSKIVIWVS
jgi:LCP family protein required for cell wall assembly